MKLSVVIPAFNQSQFILQCLTSILSQTFKDFELLFYDDGSTDNTLAIAQQALNNIPNTYIFSGANRGQTPCLIDGFSKATGQYFTWVDGDDFLDPSCFAQMVAALDANPSNAWGYSNYENVDIYGKSVGLGWRCLIPYSKAQLLKTFCTFHMQMFRSTAYNQAGGFDPGFVVVQDYDLCLKLSEISDPVRVELPLYSYRNHPNQLTSTSPSTQEVYAQKAIQAAMTRRAANAISQ